ncbi:hypothetical protein BGZ47_010112 [Haplosporangium gracile]|nr:hypothetical protein BGZ47_010112 [Haplosporangium gracile]
MRVSFSEPAKCSLIFESLKYCPCATCNSWKTLEIQPFKDNPQRTYGVIDLEGHDQVVSFQVCWDHQMLMNLIAYPDRQTVRTSDLDLFVCGWKRNTLWTGNIVFEGNLCVVTVEVFYVIAALASAPSSLPSAVAPPSPPSPLIAYHRRSPQLFVNHLHYDTDIKVEVNDCYYQQSETIKVEVDDFYKPKIMLSPTLMLMSMSMVIPKPTPTPAPVPENQEIDCAQGQYRPPPSFLPRPCFSQDEPPCHQYTPPPPTVKKEEKEIEWGQQPFPPPPLPPRRPNQEDAAGITNKSSKHGDAFWRRFNARIRPRP